MDDAQRHPHLEILDTLDSFTSQILPGDNLIFYYAGHGKGSKVDRLENEGLMATKYDITWDNLLTDWFKDASQDASRPAKWESVNKLFLLDSCYSEGFWLSELGDTGDLSSLSKVALIAGATELAENTSFISGPYFGEGHFSVALEDGLTIKMNGFAVADLGDDGLSFDDLKTFLKNYPTYYPAYQNGIEGYIRSDSPPETVTVPWNPAAEQSADYTLNLPEPTGFGWIGLGALTLLRRRRSGPVKAAPQA